MDGQQESKTVTSIMATTGSSDEDHAAYMRQCIELARCSPPLPTNFRVGAMLMQAHTRTVLSSGYTNECPGNTHAEQVCLMKLARIHGVTEEGLATLDVMRQGGLVLYTTVEPCVKRLSGNKPCVERIVDLRAAGNAGIETVYVGVKEPETFVPDNAGQSRLESEGIQVVHLPGMEEEILQVATAGHEKS